MSDDNSFVEQLPKYSKHFIRFITKTEYLIEIDDYISDDDAMYKFLNGVYDDRDAIQTGKMSLDSATVDTVYQSFE